MSSTRRVKSALRILGLVALGVVALGGIGLQYASTRIAGPVDTGPVAEAGPGDVERGRVLATRTLICTECHGADLGGGTVVDGTPGVIIAPDLTGRRSFAEWDRAVRHGVAADGRPLLMMPSDGYSRLSVSDLRDLVAYLDQLPRVTRELPPSRLSPLGVVLAATGALHVPALTLDHAAVARTPEPTATGSMARGAYLLDVSGCRGCHGPSFEGRSMGPDLPVAPPLTREALLARGRPAFLAAMTEGRRHDGATLHPVMPWRAFSTWPGEDLDGVWQALTGGEERR